MYGSAVLASPSTGKGDYGRRSYCSDGIGRGGHFPPDLVSALMFAFEGVSVGGVGQEDIEQAILGCVLLTMNSVVCAFFEGGIWVHRTGYRLCITGNMVVSLF